MDIYRPISGPVQFQFPSQHGKRIIEKGKELLKSYFEIFHFIFLDSTGNKKIKSTGSHR